MNTQTRIQTTAPTVQETPDNAAVSQASVPGFVRRVAARAVAVARVDRTAVSVRSRVVGVFVSSVLVGAAFAGFASMQGQVMLAVSPDGQMGRSTPSVSAVDSREAGEQVRIAQLSKKFDCRPEGFGEEVIPARALVRFPDKFEGRTRVVSFDRGWAVAEGSESGVLVAFCAK